MNSKPLIAQCRMTPAHETSHDAANRRCGDVRLARVFARRTNATPNDSLAFFGPPDMFPVNADACHISVTFTYDLPIAERLAHQWKAVGPITIGGPALGEPSGEFVPGRYLAIGNVITSRGCPNRCWFCLAAKREKTIRELPIRDGWRIHDDNLLATSRAHQDGVFAMLRRQRMPASFVGGFEAARFTDWHVEQLLSLKVACLFFAYDTEDDWEPLVEACKKLDKAKWRFGHRTRCYVLCGYPGDTTLEAERRVRRACNLGLFPQAMVYRDVKGTVPRGWSAFARVWSRPAITYRLLADKGTRSCLDGLGAYERALAKRHGIPIDAEEMTQ